MGRKFGQPQQQKDKILVKYVKVARCWCRTTFADGKQKQEWFHTEKEAKNYKLEEKE